MSERFEFDFTDGDASVTMKDTLEQTIFVMEIDQVEALLKWFCKKFHKKVI